MEETFRSIITQPEPSGGKPPRIHGNDFEPLIAAANGFKPDIGLFLTILEGPAGKTPT